jgi:hypothetical protein
VCSKIFKWFSKGSFDGTEMFTMIVKRSLTPAFHLAPSWDELWSTGVNLAPRDEHWPLGVNFAPRGIYSCPLWMKILCLPLHSSIH